MNNPSRIGSLLLIPDIHKKAITNQQETDYLLKSLMSDGLLLQYTSLCIEILYSEEVPQAVNGYFLSSIDHMEHDPMLENETKFT